MKDIVFVSYDGKYPNLCSGTLTLKIDSEDHTFRYCLSSGGRVYHDGNWNWTVESGEWTFDPEYATIDKTAAGRIKKPLSLKTKLYLFRVPTGILFIFLGTIFIQNKRT